MLSLCAVASPAVGQGVTARAILLAAGGNPVMGNPGEDCRVQAKRWAARSKAQTGAQGRAGVPEKGTGKAAGPPSKKLPEQELR